MSGSDLVLHVGMPRSGPPLRQALRALRPQLHAHAVAFLGREELNRLPHTKAWHSNGRPRAAHADAFSRELRAAVYTERQAPLVHGAAQRQLVLSSDRLAGSGPLGLADSERFRPHAERAIAHVIESLAARRVRVILYTHRQDRLMELAYLRRIQAGDRHSFAEQFPYRFEAVLDYLDLIDRLRTVPQVTDVVVRPVEFLDAGTHAFTNDFLSAVGLEDALDLYALGSDLSIHPGVYSGTAARLALAIRALLESDEEIRLVNSFLAKNLRPGNGTRPTCLTRMNVGAFSSATPSATPNSFELSYPSCRPTVTPTTRRRSSSPTWSARPACRRRTRCWLGSAASLPRV